MHEGRFVVAVGSDRNTRWGVHVVPKKPSVICPLCALQDELEYTFLGDGAWAITCYGHDPSYEFSSSSDNELLGGAGGVAEEFGLAELLLASLRGDGAYEEYGIIEYRFGLANPGEYGE